MGKFEDAATGDVKYVDFIQAVDEQHTGQTKDMERDRKERYVEDINVIGPIVNTREWELLWKYIVYFYIKLCQ